MTSRKNTAGRLPDQERICLHAAAATSAGHVRARNEDSSFIDEESGLFVVSDGIGGAQAGDVASRMVTTVLPRMILSRLARGREAHSQAIRSWLRRDMLSLSKGIYLESVGNPLTEGMGATVVLVLVLANRAFVGHMGDSRVYWYRAERLTQLTLDHSVLSLLLRAGEISVAEAQVHPARGRLTRYMGMKEESHPDIRTIRLRGGDRLLLCTDGLSGMISSDRIARILGLFRDPAEACRRLVETADDAGGSDNATALIVNVDGEPTGL